MKDVRRGVGCFFQGFRADDPPPVTLSVIARVFVPIGVPLPRCPASELEAS
jgi:hypothetical protein